MKSRAGLVVAAVLLGLVTQGFSPVGQASRVTVHVVVEQPIPVTETSRVVPGTVVRDLPRDDFEVLSDSQAVPIESFAPENGSVALVVLLDTSASCPITQDWMLEPVQKSLVPGLRPGDQVRVGRFGGTPPRLSPRFATDPREIVAATHALLDGDWGLGPSPVWDAVDAGVTALEAVSGRRAIIVLTDGRSTANVHGRDQVTRHAVESDVTVYTIGEAMTEIILQQDASVARVRPSLYVEELTASTGGAYVPVFGREPFRPSPDEGAAIKRWLGRLFDGVMNDLHSGYAIGFSSVVADGQMHQLEVRVKQPGLKVRVRKGYVAQKP